MMDELLVLVDENDNELGVMDKLSIHRSGVLHRAFSLFIFNSRSELLLQQRASVKYHSGGLWSNSCCSHPRLGESVPDALSRRLKEEMGIECPAHFKFSFIYKVELENGLMEHELDHVYFGITDERPSPDNAEVQAWKYLSLPALEAEIMHSPEKYSAWLKICLPEVKSHFINKAIEYNA